MSAAGSEAVDPARAQGSRLAIILGVTTSVHIIALIAVGLRLYGRVMVAKESGRDDAVMVTAAACAVASLACYIIQAQHGLGSHFEFVGDSDRIAFGAAEFVLSITNILGLAFLKISLLLSLMKLNTNRMLLRGLWAITTFVIAQSLFSCMILLLSCTPIEGFWNKSIDPTCYDANLFTTLSITSAVLSVFTDIVLATLPIPMIRTIHLQSKTRAYLAIIMGIGWIAVFLGIAKAVYQVQFLAAAAEDKTFAFGVQFWAFLQLNVAIVAVNLPTLQPILSLRRSRADSIPRFTTSAPSRSRRHRYIKQEVQARPTDAFTLAFDDHRPDVFDAYHASIHGGDPEWQLKLAAGHGLVRTMSNKLQRKNTSPETPRSTVPGRHLGDGGEAGGIVRTTEVIVSSK
ncbi:hypothetical protein F5Y15DRAFT_197512 [Xylariaceae sp. FL0016]|nr:hypothetical protein F5Y15DRAFT_197512 [Xylariaceae sp. FL0016]